MSITAVVETFHKSLPQAEIYVYDNNSKDDTTVLVRPVLATYLETGLVPRLPTAILSTGFMLLAFLSGNCGLILESVSRGRWEQKRIAYLSYPSAAIPPKPDGGNG